MNLRKCIPRTGICLDSLLCLLYFLGTSNIFRILSGKCKLCQSQWVGTERGCLSGRNQLVRCGHRIVNLGNNFQHKILRKRAHSRPVLDIWSKLDLHTRISHSLAVKDTILIDLLIKEVFRVAELYIQIRCGCQITLVGRCRSDRTRIHQCYGSNLSVLYLRALTVREVTCRMTDGKCIICRCISGTKARSAECSLDNGTCLQQIGNGTVLNQFHINRSRRRVYTQRKLVRSNGRTL